MRIITDSQKSCIDVAAEYGMGIAMADPVEIVMNGRKEEISQAVEYCVSIGKCAKKGYHLATGCDIPETTAPEQIDYFMEAARKMSGKK